MRAAEIVARRALRRAICCCEARYAAVRQHYLVPRRSCVMSEAYFHPRHLSEALCGFADCSYPSDTTSRACYADAASAYDAKNITCMRPEASIRSYNVQHIHCLAAGYGAWRWLSRHLQWCHVGDASAGLGWWFWWIHVSSIQPMHCLDSGDRLEVRLSSATRGKGACGTRVQVFGRERAAQRNRIN